MKKFRFTNNPSGKELRVELEGMFNAQDAEDFVKEYKSIISKIKPTETVFNVDCTKMIITPQDVVPQLQGCFEMYRDDKFKKVVFIVSKDKGAILKAQFNRLGRTVGLTNMEVTN